MLRSIIGGLGLALCLTLAPAAVHAKALSITEAEPVAVVTFPDDWETEKTARGIEIQSPDDEVYVWFELVSPAEMPAVQKEHDSYFASEGVKIVSSGDTVSQEVNGRMWSFTELKGANKDGEQIIRYVAINPNLPSGKIILMTYWASLEGHKDHDAVMDAAMKSLAFK